MDWNKINCRECTGHCNQKGAPSASKGSIYCKNQRGLFGTKEKKDKLGVIQRAKIFLGRVGAYH